jgi:hypothetical protein
MDIILIEKIDILRKLHDLKSYGIELSENYSINSDIIKMKAEYAMHSDIIRFNKNIQSISTNLQTSVNLYSNFNNIYNTYDKKIDAMKDFLLFLMKFTLDQKYRIQVQNDMNNTIKTIIMLCCC